MNLLVTGGCGFIGSHLVDKLVLAGHKIFVIDNLSTGVEENCNKGAKYFFFSLEEILVSKSKVRDIFIENEIEGVFHLAALADVRKSIDEPLLAFNINSMVTFVLANLCIEHNVNKFIFSSTSAVYGEPKYLPVDESHPVNPMSPYGLSKLYSEDYLEYLSNYKGLNSIVFRFPNVYGPRQRSDLEGGVVAIFKERMQKQQNINFFGNGSQTRDWVHCFDIVRAMFSVCNLELKGYNLISLGSGFKNTLRELFDLMSTEFNYIKEPVISDPREGDILHMVMSADKASKEINWNAQISLKEGISRL